VIIIEHLSKSFGTAKAVDAVNLEIKEGEIFTLLGPSGCGKTTMLRMIAGLEEPDDGKIVLAGRVVVSTRERVFVPSHKRDLGMVFQSYAIWPHMTVFKNVAYPLTVRRIPTAEVRERVMRVLELVELSGLQDRHATQLSGGQQQRVALARALVHEPKLLLLDEPFSNLDAKLREQMRVQLKLLLKKLRITVVFVTHDQVEALSLSDRIAVMRAGRLEQLGTPRELYENPATTFTRDFLGSTVLLCGTVDRASASDPTRIRLDGIPGAPIPAPQGEAAALPAGARVCLATRPEDIAILRTNNGGDSGYLSATIETLFFAGNHYECRVRLSNGESVLLHAPRSLSLNEGDVVELALTQERLSLWPL
jgi:iron(III) transport system ATP-binding protein